MGCCASIPDVPDEIIPDPTEPSTFYLKKAGMFSSNYKVLQGGDDGPLWLFLRKHGKLFDDDSKYVLENFDRKDDPDGKQGVALCVGKVDNFISGGDDATYKQYGWTEHDDSGDDSDYSSDSDTDGSGDEWNVKQKMKFKYKGKCKFYKDRDREQKIGELKVKAKGKAKRIVQFEEVTNEETGEKSIQRTNHAANKKLKKFKYDFEVDGHGEIKIELNGSINKGGKKSWESAMFDAEVDNFCDPPTISTKEGFYPPLACMAGFVVSDVLAPSDVLSGLRIHWPHIGEYDSDSD